MMMARGDHAVFHEPFSAHYYFSAERSSEPYPDRRPEPRHHQAKVLASTTAEARRRPVFFKDMAYHVRGFAGRRFMARFVNQYWPTHGPLLKSLLVHAGPILRPLLGTS